MLVLDSVRGLIRRATQMGRVMKLQTKRRLPIVLGITAIFIGLLWYTLVRLTSVADIGGNTVESDLSGAIVAEATLSEASLVERLYQQVEWIDLIPDADLHALNNPPESLNQIEDGDLADQINSILSAAMNQSSPQTAYEKALVSTNVRAEFDEKLIRIPGFIVPLQFGEQRRVTEFFLVPFFGACLHMPPPPPNQILYSTSAEGVELETLMDAFWIEGKISTTLVSNDMATAAYSFRVDHISPYYDD